MMTKEEIESVLMCKQENAQLRALLLRCKTELGNVDPLSDSHERQIDALYDEINTHTKEKK